MKTNQLKVGAFLSYIQLFLFIFIGILYTPFMLSSLGKSQYGVYSLTASIIGYLTILDFGFGNAIVRYTAKYRALDQKDEEYNLHGMFLVIYTLIGLLSVIIGIILYSNIGAMFGNTMTKSEISDSKAMMLLLIFNLAISFPLGIFSSIIISYEKFIFAKTISIIRTLISPCIIIPILLIGYKAIGIVVATTILNLIFLLINLFYCIIKLKIKMHFKKFKLGLMKEIGVYSLFIFFNMIMDKVNWSADQLILGAVSGTIMVAIFSVASQIGMYYLSFSTAISGVFLPRITSMVTKEATSKEISDMFIKIGRIQYIVMAFILSGFILFGQNFMNSWAGKDYQDAYYIALILMVPATIPLIQNLGITILQAQNRQKFRSIVFFLLAILNIFISIPLAKLFGGIGCAIGTAISIILGQIIIMNIYYYKKIRIDIPEFWKEIFKLSIPVIISVLIGVCINYLLLGTGYFWLLIKASSFSVIYIISIWVIGLNKYEKVLFSGPVLKIFNRLIRIKG